MRAQAQPDAGGAQGLDVGNLQVLLAQMYAVSAGGQRQLPVVVDEHLRTGHLATRRDRRLHFMGNLRRRVLRRLDAQLHGAHTPTQQAHDPIGIWDHRVEPQPPCQRCKGGRVHAACQKGTPTVGVEACAAARSGMGVDS